MTKKMYLRLFGTDGARDAELRAIEEATVTPDGVEVNWGTRTLETLQTSTMYRVLDKENLIGLDLRGYSIDEISLPQIPSRVVNLLNSMVKRQW